MTVFGSYPLAVLSIVLTLGETQFPVPRAEKEFGALGTHVRGYCSRISGDFEAFRRAVLPFGPMDLAVANGTDRERRVLRNFYLGLVGASCKVDAAALAEAFHCGSSCSESRRDELVRELPGIKSVVKTFVALDRIWLISQWGIVRSPSEGSVQKAAVRGDGNCGSVKNSSRGSPLKRSHSAEEHAVSRHLVSPAGSVGGWRWRGAQGCHRSWVEHYGPSKRLGKAG